MTLGVATGLPAMSRTKLQSIDALLLAAFAVIAATGVWTRCLLVNDGVVFLLSAWLGDAWDLYYRQSASRALSILIEFGPAWALRWLLDLSSDAYVSLAHVLYFAPPVVLWLTIRAVEPQPVFSRLFLAFSLVLVYFPSEFNVAVGLWILWLAIVAHPARSAVQRTAATLGLGLALVFTHPGPMAMSLLYLLAAGGLAIMGRPVPRPTLPAAAAMTVLLLAGHLLTGRLLAPTNPTMVQAFAENSRAFLDPRVWLAAFVYSPVLPAWWLLLLLPAVDASGLLRRRVPPLMLAAVAAFGLWFAVNGIGLLTWIHARQTGSYTVALALALTLAAPGDRWLAGARRALALFTGVAVAGALSYGFDLAVLERTFKRQLAPGYVAVETLPAAEWPAHREPESLRRALFKWTAGEDYARDVVVPAYDWFRVTTAFHTFFLSDRSAVLFHRLPDNFWIPFECAPVKRALAAAHDARDAQLLRFILSEGYCVDGA
jgi:hypothetical protein